MRLEAKAKAGFYPTPPRVVNLILNHLHTHGKPTILDPCAGEGDALLAVSRALEGRAVGIELSRERAKKAASKGLRVHQGDAFHFVGQGFDLLWLNPPYDHGEGERLELSFLKHWTPALRPEGILVFIIPERILKQTAPYLRTHYGHLSVFRFPEPEYLEFGQVVVLGEKLRESLPLSAEGEGLEAEGILGEVWASYTVPGSGPGLLERRERIPDPEEILSLLEKSPLFVGRKEGEIPRPLLPLKDAHLALLLAGGLLDQQVVWMEGEPYLIRGEVRKEERTFEERGEDGRLRRVTREEFRVQVVALGLKSGDILKVA